MLLPNFSKVKYKVQIPSEGRKERRTDGRQAGRVTGGRLQEGWQEIGNDCSSVGGFFLGEEKCSKFDCGDCPTL